MCGIGNKPNSYSIHKVSNIEAYYNTVDSLLEYMDKPNASLVVSLLSFFNSITNDNSLSAMIVIT